MADGHRTAFRIQLPDDTLEEVLQRVEEHLALHPVLGEAPLEETPPEPVSRDARPTMHEGIGALRALRAPYFVLGGRVLGGLARLLNLPLRIFGRKQHLFNEHLLNLLEQWTVRSADATAERQALQARLEESRAEGERLEQDVLKSLRTMRRELRGLEDWIRLIQQHQEAQGLALRDARQSSAPGSDAWPVPRVLRRDALADHAAAHPDGPRINVGCGARPREGYLNIDGREGPGIDIAADVRRLPFEPGTVAEIASAHLVEHFREHTLRTVLLPYWRSLLRPGGLLRMVCPDWLAMLQRLQDGRMKLADFRRLTFGAQDYEGNDHLAMYTPEGLAAVLTETGFVEVCTVAADRMNDICPEMELTARRPEA